MARGGLSRDPKVRARQLEALKAGRELAASRRAAGLPTKRRESAGAKVKRGGYGGSADTGKPAAKPPANSPAKVRRTPAKKRAKAESPGKPELSGLERIYARVLGHDV